jgi:hypothetical protein
MGRSSDLGLLFILNGRLSDKSLSPGSNAVLVFPLTLVLPRLTRSPPWLNENLENFLNLVRPIMVGGGPLMPGPTLIVPSICLYHWRYDKGGGCVSTGLLQPGDK